MQFSVVTVWATATVFLIGISNGHVLRREAHIDSASPNAHNGLEANPDEQFKVTHKSHYITSNGHSNNPEGEEEKQARKFDSDVIHNKEEQRVKEHDLKAVPQEVKVAKEYHAGIPVDTMEGQKDGQDIKEENHVDNLRTNNPAGKQNDNGLEYMTHHEENKEEGKERSINNKKAMTKAEQKMEENPVQEMEDPEERIAEEVREAENNLEMIPEDVKIEDGNYYDDLADKVEELEEKQNLERENLNAKDITGTKNEDETLEQKWGEESSNGNMEDNKRSDKFKNMDEEEKVQIKQNIAAHVGEEVRSPDEKRAEKTNKDQLMEEESAFDKFLDNLEEKLEEESKEEQVFTDEKENEGDKIEAMKFGDNPERVTVHNPEEIVKEIINEVKEKQNEQQEQNSQRENTTDKDNIETNTTPGNVAHKTVAEKSRNNDNEMKDDVETKETRFGYEGVQNNMEHANNDLEKRTTHKSEVAQNKHEQVEQSVKNMPQEDKKHEEMLLKHKHKKYETHNNDDNLKKHSHEKENKFDKETKDVIKNMEQTGPSPKKHGIINEDNIKQDIITDSSTEVHTLSNSFQTHNNSSPKVNGIAVNMEHLEQESLVEPTTGGLQINNNDENMDDAVEQFEFDEVIPNPIDNIETTQNSDIIGTHTSNGTEEPIENVEILRVRGDVAPGNEPEIHEIDIINVTKIDINEADLATQPSTIVEIIEITHDEENTNDQQNSNNDYSSNLNDEMKPDIVVDALHIIKINDNDKIEGSVNKSITELEKDIDNINTVLVNDVLENFEVQNPVKDAVDAVNVTSNNTEANTTKTETGTNVTDNSVPLAYIEFPRDVMEVVDLPDADNTSQAGNNTQNKSTLEVTSYEDVILFPDGIMEVVTTKDKDENITRFYNFKDHETNAVSAEENQDVTFNGLPKVENVTDQANLPENVTEVGVTDNKPEGVTEMPDTIENITNLDSVTDSTTNDVTEAPLLEATDADKNVVTEIIPVTDTIKLNLDKGDVSAGQQSTNTTSNETPLENSTASEAAGSKHQTDNITVLDITEESNKVENVTVMPIHAENITENANASDVTSDVSTKENVAGTNINEIEPIIASINEIEDSTKNNEMLVRKKRQLSGMYKLLSGYAGRPDSDSEDVENASDVGENVNKDTIIVIAHSVKNVTLEDKSPSEEVKKTNSLVGNNTKVTEKSNKNFENIEFTQEPTLEANADLIRNVSGNETVKDIEINLKELSHSNSENENKEHSTTIVDTEAGDKTEKSSLANELVNLNATSLEGNGSKHSVPIEQQLVSNYLDTEGEVKQNGNETEAVDMIVEVANNKYNNQESINSTIDEDLKMAGEAVNDIENKEQAISELVSNTNSSEKVGTQDSAGTPARKARSLTHTKPLTSTIYKSGQGNAGYPQVMQVSPTLRPQVNPYSVPTWSNNRFKVPNQKNNQQTALKPLKKPQEPYVQRKNVNNNDGKVNVNHQLEGQSSYPVPRILDPYSSPNDILSSCPQSQLANIPTDATVIVVVPEKSHDDSSFLQYPPPPPPFLPPFSQPPLWGIPLIPIYPSPYPNL